MKKKKTKHKNNNDKQLINAKSDYFVGKIIIDDKTILFFDSRYYYYDLSVDYFLFVTLFLASSDERLYFLTKGFCSFLYHSTFLIDLFTGCVAIRAHKPRK